MPDEFGDIGGFGDFNVTPYRVRRRSRSRPKADPKPPDPGLMSNIASTGLGGLAAVGNLLDVPGSMVRDVMSSASGTPRNPFDQLLSPFSDKNRVTGRDLLRQWGTVGKKDTWGNFAGGLAFELATDPTTWLSFGMKDAIGKGAKALRYGGVLDDVALKAASKGIGPRAFRMGNTVESAIKMADDPAKALKRFQDVVKAKGWNEGELLKEQLGGMFKAKMPFVGEGKVFGGKMAQAVGKKLDTAQKFLTDNPIANRLRSKFIRGTEHSYDFASQMQGIRSLRHGQETIGAGRGLLAKSYQSMRGMLDDKSENGMLLINALESPTFKEAIMNGQLPPHLPVGASQEFADHLPQIREFIELHDGMLKDMHHGEMQDGLKANAVDDYIENYNKMDYSPRVRTFINRDRYNAMHQLRAEFDVKNPHQIARRIGLRDTYSGTRALTEMGQDLGLKIEYTDTVSGKVVKKPIVGLGYTISRYQDLPQLYSQIGHEIQRVYGKKLGHLNTMDAQQMNDLVKWITHIEPEHATQKITPFSVDPFANVMRRLEHSVRARQAANNVTDLALNAGGRVDEILNGRPESVSSMLSRAGMDPEHGAAAVQRKYLKAMQRGDKKIIEKTAKLLNTSDPIGELSRMPSHDFANLLHVPEQQVQHAQNHMQLFTNPQEASMVAKGLDMFNRMFKSSVTTPWPRFHFRNAVSGAVQNVLLGLIKPQHLPRALANAYHLLSGNAAHKFEGALAGHTFDDVWNMIVQDDVIGRHGMGATDLGAPTAEELAKKRATSAFAMEMPKGMPQGRKSLTQTVFPEGGKIPVRYGTGAAQTAKDVATAVPRFALKTGNQIGNFVESMNRLSAYVNLLENGVHHSEAARMVKRAQIDYGSATKWERDYAKRVAPFYMFSSRILPPVIEELASKPGGAMAQTLRVANRARNEDDITPEYVTETVGLPWEMGALKPPEGTNRYITGLGLMHEDPVGLLGMVSHPRQLMLEGISRMTPPLRIPLEMAFGQVTHQRDATGGREIEDLDPTIARAFQNISDTMSGKRRENIESPLGISKPTWQNIEVLSQLLPVSQVATQLRQAFDPRKQKPIKALNLLTGVRVTDVSPAAQDAILRERANALERQMGAREFPTVYFPQEMKAKMTKAQLDKALALENLQRGVESRRRQRKKVRKASLEL